VITLASKNNYYKRFLVFLLGVLLMHAVTYGVLYASSDGVTEETLMTVLSSPNFKIGDAFFLYGQNHRKIDILNKVMGDNSDKKPPILEFKRITPVRYRIIVHRAKFNFVMVFSESFHPQWKLYPITSRNDRAGIPKEMLHAYRVLDGNESFQASRTEFGEYLSKGIISTLGKGESQTGKSIPKIKDLQEALSNDEYAIDFVSKNIRHTIQNNNLPDGPIHETWSYAPLDEKYHLIANGFANSWIIELDYLESRGSDILRQNADGTYDFELVLEFKNQRIFYIGVFISVLTLFLTLVALFCRTVWRFCSNSRSSHYCACL
jgi:hypothetical protein